MSTIAAVPDDTATRAPQGRYGFTNVARMEWIKLRSLRSTGWGFGILAAAMIGFAVLVLGLTSGHWAHLSAGDKATFDPTNQGFTGLVLGQLVIAILGVLTITSEFSSGLVRATFAAAPRRPLVLAAKAAVFGGAALVAGEVLAFISFFAGEAVLHGGAPHVTLATPGVLRAVLMAGAYVCLCGLFGLGLGAIIRHSAGAIAAAVGVIFALPLLLLPLPESMRNGIVKFLPEQIAASGITAVKPEAHTLSPWVGLGMLCLYAAGLLAAGAFLLAKRDA
jgi:ABC-2 type transport system permease protein